MQMHCRISKYPSNVKDFFKWPWGVKSVGERLDPWGWRCECTLTRTNDGIFSKFGSEPFVTDFLAFLSSKSAVMSSSFTWGLAIEALQFYFSKMVTVVTSADTIKNNLVKAWVPKFCTSLSRGETIGRGEMLLKRSIVLGWVSGQKYTFCFTVVLSLISCLSGCEKICMLCTKQKESSSVLIRFLRHTVLQKFSLNPLKCFLNLSPP